MALTLVTGASGFVGSVLMEELRRQGIPARGVSRSPSAGLIEIPTYDQEMDWEPLLAGVDTVVHLAARVHVMKDRATDPLSDFRKANVDATLHLAHAAARAGVRRFIFVSTIKVNGETTKPGAPFKADDLANPQGPYAVSKAEAEAGLFDIGRNTGLEIVIIRPPLVHGPGVKGNLATLARWGRFALPSPFSTVKNKRSLVHVLNLCSAILAARQQPEAANEVFLVADGTAISTHDLLLNFGWTEASKPVKILLAPMVPTLLGLRKSTRDRLLANLEVDIEKSIRLLNWRPVPFSQDRNF